jgi:hypothetical protein
VAGLSSVALAKKSPVDGTDFSDWQSFGTAAWTAEGTELVGRFDQNRPGPGYIFTRDVFTDFRLALVFRISGIGKSCIYVREPLRRWDLIGENRPGAGPAAGYEVVIDYRDQDSPTGTISDVQRSKKLVGTEEEWNEMVIVCKGTEMRVSVEGQCVNRFNQSRVQAGGIGFGIVGPPSKDYMVRFRDVVISPVT